MTVTSTLLDKMLDTLQDYYESNFSYLAVGTGTTSPSQSDTALESETLRKSRQEYERDDANGKFTVSMWVSTLEANGNDLGEAGVFQQSSGGIMYARETFTPITKTSDIEIWIDFEFTTEVVEE